jgi:hypothetical protein
LGGLNSTIEYPVINESGLIVGGAETGEADRGCGDTRFSERTERRVSDQPC